MVRAERPPQHERETPLSIVRVVPIAPVSIPEFLNRVQRARKAGIPLDTISFSEVVLIQKSNISTPSAGLLMAPGGEAAPEESIVETGLREVGEETLLFPLSDAWAGYRQDKSAFSYRIPGYEQPRKVDVFVLPVKSRSVSSHRAREEDGNEDKIANIVHVSPEELEQIIHTGILARKNKMPLAVAGNFTMAHADDIEISPEHRGLRDQVLSGIIKDAKSFDRELKDAVLDQINRTRQEKQKSSANNLDECTNDELTKGFLLTQMNLEFYGATEPITGKINLLRMANIVSASPARLIPDIISSEFPPEIANMVERFAPSFEEGMRALLQLMNVDKKFYENVNGPRLYKAFRRTWQDITKLPADKAANILRIANNAMMHDLSTRLETSQESLTNTLTDVTLPFHNFITESLKNHPDFQGNLFQEFRPRSELTSNPLLFTITALSLGFDPDREKLSQSKMPEIENRRLPFEALKILALFNVAIDVTKNLREADNQILQRAINRIFQEKPKPEYIDLGEGKLHPTVHRVTRKQINGKNIIIEYDEREKKTPASTLRKAFQDPDRDDTYAVNFVITESNFTEDSTVMDRIDLAEKFRNMLLEEIKGSLSVEPGVEWKLSIKPGTHKRGVIDALSSSLKKGEDIDRVIASGGKRAGSEGNRILREKFAIVLENNQGVKETLEVSIYPFQSTTLQSVAVLGKNGLWGFDQKIRDDYKGTYGANRILRRRKPTEPSLHEDFYPRPIYGVSERMWKHQVRSRKRLLEDQDAA